MRTGNWIVIAAIVFVVLAILVFLPVPIPEDKDCLVVKGTVAEIYEAGTKDMVFKLNGHERIYYVNRGLERGLNLKKLKAEMIGKEITIKYPRYWTPLDPGNSVRHISKIESKGRIVFTEID